jgi:hypothetical protein
MSVSDWHNDLAVPAVEIGALDGSVVQVWNAHVGPVDMTGVDIDDDAVRKMTPRHNRSVIGAIGIHDVNFVGVQLENEKPGNCSRRDNRLGRFHGATI